MSSQSSLNPMTNEQTQALNEAMAEVMGWELIETETFGNRKGDLVYVNNDYDLKAIHKVNLGTPYGGHVEKWNPANDLNQAVRVLEQCDYYFVIFGPSGNRETKWMAGINPDYTSCPETYGEHESLATAICLAIAQSEGIEIDE